MYDLNSVTSVESINFFQFVAFRTETVLKKVVEEMICEAESDPILIKLIIIGDEISAYEFVI